MNPRVHVVYPSLQFSANSYCVAALCGFFIPSIEELLPAYAQVLYCPVCTIMWSVPVCVCCADVLQSRVVSGLQATVSVWTWGWILTPQVLHGTTGALTRRQSVVPCTVLSLRTDRQWGHKLETCLKPTDVPNSQTSQLSFECTLFTKTQIPYNTFQDKALITKNY